MTRDELVATACELRQPSAATAEEYESKLDACAAGLNARMAAREDLDRLIGAGNKAMMEDNSRNFCRFMSSVFRHYQPETLVDTALWVFRAYRSHGFHLSFWPANIDTAMAAVEATITPEAFKEVRPFYQWLVVNVPSFTAISDKELSTGSQS